MPTTNQNLDRLIERFWGPPTPGSPVHVTTGDLPDSHVLVEDYAVVPSIRRARFLVPARAPRAVSAAFSSHLTTVSPSSRATGGALALAFRSGAGPRVLTDRLRVGIDRKVPVHDRRDHLVLQELAHGLDAPDVVAVHPVRRATPNAKPTARLFSPQGAALGYAKLGWSPPTAGLVQNEAAVLAALGGDVAGLTVPTPRASGRWDGHSISLQYLVTSALPPGLRAWRAAPEEVPAILTGIVETGERETCRLVDSRYAESVRARLSGAARAEPEAVAALQRWFGTLERCDHLLSFGRWHGDWVAWNLARTVDGGAAWDWEYSAPQAPVGFDLLHWHFQSSLADPAATLDTAADALARRMSGLERLGLAPHSHRHVADLYLLEMLTRAVGLAAEGSGWNPKLYPSLISFATRAAVASST